MMGLPLDGLTVLVTLAVVYIRLVDANNVCYVEESGCKFRVTVLPVSSCPASHVNDQPRVSEVMFRCSKSK